MTTDQVFDLLHEDDRFVDVWSFHARERLKVHEARTAAELDSGVVRDRQYREQKTKVAYLNLRVMRDRRWPVA